MGESRAAAFFGRAELHHHHRFASPTRGPASVEEALAVVDRLQVGDDHPGVFIGGEKPDVVGGGQPRLVTAGHHVAGVDAAFLQGALDGHGETARLADDGHRAAFQDLGPVVGHGHQRTRRRHVAETIGAGHGQASIDDGGAQLVAEGAAFVAADFIEPGREHGGAARPRRGAVTQHASHRLGGHQDHQMVRRLGKAGHGFVTLDVPDLVAPWIERIHRFPVIVALEVAPYPRGPASRPIRCPHQHHIAWVQQSRDLLDAGERFGFPILVGHGSSLDFSRYLTPARSPPWLDKDRPVRA